MMTRPIIIKTIPPSWCKAPVRKRISTWIANKVKVTMRTAFLKSDTGTTAMRSSILRGFDLRNKRVPRRVTIYMPSVERMPLHSGAMLIVTPGRANDVPSLKAGVPVSENNSATIADDPCTRKFVKASRSHVGIGIARSRNNIGNNAALKTAEP